MLGREKLSVLSRFLFTALSKKFITHVIVRSLANSVISLVISLFYFETHRQAKDCSTAASSG